MKFEKFLRTPVFTEHLSVVASAPFVRIALLIEPEMFSYDGTIDTF